MNNDPAIRFSNPNAYSALERLKGGVEGEVYNPEQLNKAFQTFIKTADPKSVEGTIYSLGADTAWDSTMSMIRPGEGFAYRMQFLEENKGQFNKLIINVGNQVDPSINLNVSTDRISADKKLEVRKYKNYIRAIDKIENEWGVNVIKYGDPQNKVRLHTKIWGGMFGGKPKTFISTGNLNDASTSRQTNLGFMSSDSKLAEELRSINQQLEQNLIPTSTDNIKVGKDATRNILDMLEVATKGSRVIMMSPYINEERLIEASYRAIRRGAYVSLITDYNGPSITPGAPDEYMRHHRYIAKLQAVGVNVMSEHPAFSTDYLTHAKGVAIQNEDGTAYGLLGSHNFSRPAYENESIDILVRLAQKSAKDLFNILDAFPDTYNTKNTKFLVKYRSSMVLGGFEEQYNLKTKRRAWGVTSVHRDEFTEFLLPYYPTRLDNTHFRRYRNEELPYVPLYEEVYMQRTGKDYAPWGVKELDLAISKPSLGESINRAFKTEWYKEGQGIIGSSLTTVGRKLDNIFGYYDYKEHKRLVNYPNAGGIGSFLGIDHRPPREQDDKGAFETILRTSYDLVSGTAMALGTYLGINLPLQHIRAFASQEVLTSVLDPQKDSWVGTRLVTDQARNVLFGPTMGSLISKITRESSTEADVSKGFKRFFDALYTISKESNPLASIDTLANFTDDDKEYLRSFISKDNKVLMPKSFLESSAAPNQLILGDEGERSLFQMMGFFRRFDARRYNTIGVPILLAINPYAAAGTGDQPLLNQLYKASVGELSSTLRLLPVLNYGATVGTDGNVSSTKLTYENIGQGRVKQLAKALDRVGALLPVNISYWVPGLRTSLGLTDFNPYDNMVWRDVLSLEEASDSVHSTMRLLSSGLGVQWKRVNSIAKDSKKGLKGFFTSATLQSLNKTVEHIYKTTKQTYKQALVVRSRGKQYEYSKQKMFDKLSHIMLNSSGDTLETELEAFFKGTNSDSLEFTNFIKKQTELDKAYTSFRSRLGLSAEINTAHPFEESQLAGMNEANKKLFLETKAKERFVPEHGSPTALRKARFKKGILLLGALALTDSAIDFTFMKGGANLLTQIMARNKIPYLDNLEDEEGTIARFKYTSDAPGYLSIGAAIGGASVATLLSPSYFTKGNAVDLAEYVTRLPGGSSVAKTFINKFAKNTIVSGYKYNVKAAWAGGLIGLFASKGLAAATAFGLNILHGNFDAPTLHTDKAIISTLLNKKSQEGLWTARMTGHKYDYLISAGLEQMAQSNLTGDEAGMRVYNMATQFTLPFFQLAAIAKLDETKGTFSTGIGFQLAPVLGLGASPMLPFSLQLQEGDSTSLQDADAFSYLSTPLRTANYVTQMGTGMLLLGQDLVYNDQSNFRGSMQFIGTALLASSLVSQENQRALLKGAPSGLRHKLANEIATVRGITESGIGKAIGALTLGTVKNLTTLPFFFAQSSLRAFNTPFIRNYGLGALSIMTIWGFGSHLKRNIWDVYNRKQALENPELYKDNDRGLAGDLTQVALTGIGATTLTLAAKSIAPSIVKKGLLKKVAPYYIGLVGARMISQIGANFEGYEVDDRAEHMQATIGIGLGAGYLLHKSGAFAPSSSLLTQFYKTATAEEVRDLLVSTNIASEKAVDAMVDTYKKRIQRRPKYTEASTVKRPTSTILHRSALQDLITGDLYNDLFSKTTFSQDLLNNTSFNISAQEVLNQQSFRRMKGRVASAAMLLTVGYLGATALNDLTPRPVRSYLQTVPILGSSLKVLSGTDMRLPEYQDQKLGLGYWLGRFIPKGWHSALGIYQDRPDPFFQTVGGFGASFKDTGISSYFQLASNLTDLSASAALITRRKEDATHLQKVLLRSQNKSAIGMYQSYRGFTARKTPMKISDLSRYDLAAAGGVLTDINIRQFKQEQLKWQKPYELQMDLFLDLAGSGYVRHPHTIDFWRAKPTFNVLFSMFKDGVQWYRPLKIREDGRRVMGLQSSDLKDIDMYLTSNIYKTSLMQKTIGGGDILTDILMSFNRASDSPLGSLINVGAKTIGGSLALGGILWGGLQAITSIAGAARKKTTLELLERSSSVNDIFTPNRYKFRDILINNKSRLVQIDLHTRGKYGVVASNIDLDSLLQQARTNLGSLSIHKKDIVKGFQNAYGNLLNQVSSFFNNDFLGVINDISKLEGIDISSLKKSYLGKTRGKNNLTIKSLLEGKLKRILQNTLTMPIHQGLPNITLANQFSNSTLDELTDYLLHSGQGVNLIDSILNDMFEVQGRNLYNTKTTEGLAQQRIRLGEARYGLGTMEFAAKITKIAGSNMTLLEEVYSTHNKIKYQTMIQSEAARRSRLYTKSGYAHKAWSEGFLMELGYFGKGSASLIGGWLNVGKPAYEVIEGLSLGLNKSNPELLRREGYSNVLKSLSYTGTAMALNAGLNFLGIGGLPGLGLSIGIMLLSSSLRANNGSGLSRENVLFDNIANFFVDPSGTLNSMFGKPGKAIGNGIEWTLQKPASLLSLLAKPFNYISTELTGPFIAKQYSSMITDWGMTSFTKSLLLPMTAINNDWIRKLTGYKYTMQRLQEASQADHRVTTVHPFMLGGNSSRQDVINNSKYFKSYAPGGRILSSFGNGPVYKISNLMMLELNKRQGLDDLQVAGFAAKRLSQTTERGIRPWLTLAGIVSAPFILNSLRKSSLATNIYQDAEYLTSRVSKHLGRSVFGNRYAARREVMRLAEAVGAPRPKQVLLDPNSIHTYYDSTSKVIYLGKDDATLLANYNRGFRVGANELQGARFNILHELGHSVYNPRAITQSAITPNSPLYAMAQQSVLETAKDLATQGKGVMPQSQMQALLQEELFANSYAYNNLGLISPNQQSTLNLAGYTDELIGNINTSYTNLYESAPTTGDYVVIDYKYSGTQGKSRLRARDLSTRQRFSYAYDLGYSKGYKKISKRPSTLDLYRVKTSKNYSQQTIVDQLAAQSVKGVGSTFAQTWSNAIDEFNKALGEELPVRTSLPSTATKLQKFKLAALRVSDQLGTTPFLKGVRNASRALNLNRYLVGVSNIIDIGYGFNSINSSMYYGVKVPTRYSKGYLAKPLAEKSIRAGYSIQLNALATTTAGLLARTISANPLFMIGTMFATSQLQRISPGYFGLVPSLSNRAIHKAEDGNYINPLLQTPSFYARANRSYVGAEASLRKLTKPLRQFGKRALKATFNVLASMPAKAAFGLGFVSLIAANQYEKTKIRKKWDNLSPSMKSQYSNKYENYYQMTRSGVMQTTTQFSKAYIGFSAAKMLYKTRVGKAITHKGIIPIGKALLNIPKLGVQGTYLTLKTGWQVLSFGGRLLSSLGKWLTGKEKSIRTEQLDESAKAIGKHLPRNRQRWLAKLLQNLGQGAENLLSGFRSRTMAILEGVSSIPQHIATNYNSSVIGRVISGIGHKINRGKTWAMGILESPIVTKIKDIIKTPFRAIGQAISNTGVYKWLTKTLAPSRIGYTVGATKAFIGNQTDRLASWAGRNILRQGLGNLALDTLGYGLDIAQLAWGAHKISQLDRYSEKAEYQQAYATAYAGRGSLIGTIAGSILLGPVGGLIGGVAGSIIDSSIGYRVGTKRYNQQESGGGLLARDLLLGTLPPILGIGALSYIGRSIYKSKLRSKWDKLDKSKLKYSSYDEYASLKHNKVGWFDGFRKARELEQMEAYREYKNAVARGESPELKGRLKKYAAGHEAELAQLKARRRAQTFKRRELWVRANPEVVLANDIRAAQSRQRLQDFKEQLPLIYNNIDRHINKNTRVTINPKASIYEKRMAYAKANEGITFNRALRSSWPNTQTINYANLDPWFSDLEAANTPNPYNPNITEYPQVSPLFIKGDPKLPTTYSPTNPFSSSKVKSTPTEGTERSHFREPGLDNYNRASQTGKVPGGADDIFLTPQQVKAVVKDFEKSMLYSGGTDSRAISAIVQMDQTQMSRQAVVTQALELEAHAVQVRLVKEAKGQEVSPKFLDHFSKMEIIKKQRFQGDVFAAEKIIGEDLSTKGYFDYSLYEAPGEYNDINRYYSNLDFYNSPRGQANNIAKRARARVDSIITKIKTITGADSVTEEIVEINGIKSVRFTPQYNNPSAHRQGVQKAQLDKQRGGYSSKEDYLANVKKQKEELAKPLTLAEKKSIKTRELEGRLNEWADQGDNLENFWKRKYEMNVAWQQKKGILPPQTFIVKPSTLRDAAYIKAEEEIIHAMSQGQPLSSKINPVSTYAPVSPFNPNAIRPTGSPKPISLIDSTYVGKGLNSLEQEHSYLKSISRDKLTSAQKKRLNTLNVLDRLGTLFDDDGFYKDYEIKRSKLKTDFSQPLTSLNTLAYPVIEDPWSNTSTPDQTLPKVTTVNDPTLSPTIKGYLTGSVPASSPVETVKTLPKIIESTPGSITKIEIASTSGTITFTEIPRHSTPNSIKSKVKPSLSSDDLLAQKVAKSRVMKTLDADTSVVITADKINQLVQDELKIVTSTSFDLDSITDLDLNLENKLNNLLGFIDPKVPQSLDQIQRRMVLGVRTAQSIDPLSEQLKQALTGYYMKIQNSKGQYIITNNVDDIVDYLNNLGTSKKFLDISNLGSNNMLSAVEAQLNYLKYYELMAKASGIDLSTKALRSNSSLIVPLAPSVSYIPDNALGAYRIESSRIIISQKGLQGTPHKILGDIAHETRHAFQLGIKGNLWNAIPDQSDLLILNPSLQMSTAAKPFKYVKNPGKIKRFIKSSWGMAYHLAFESKLSKKLGVGKLKQTLNFLKRTLGVTTFGEDIEFDAYTFEHSPEVQEINKQVLSQGLDITHNNLLNRENIQIPTREGKSAYQIGSKIDIPLFTNTYSLNSSGKSLGSVDDTFLLPNLTPGLKVVDSTYNPNLTPGYFQGDIIHTASYSNSKKSKILTLGSKALEVSSYVFSALDIYGLSKGILGIAELNQLQNKNLYKSDLEDKTRAAYYALITSRQSLSLGMSDLGYSLFNVSARSLGYTDKLTTSRISQEFVEERIRTRDFGSSALFEYGLSASVRDARYASLAGSTIKGGLNVYHNYYKATGKKIPLVYRASQMNRGARLAQLKAARIPTSKLGLLGKASRVGGTILNIGARVIDPIVGTVGSYIALEEAKNAKTEEQFIALQQRASGSLTRATASQAAGFIPGVGSVGSAILATTAVIGADQAFNQLGIEKGKVIGQSIIDSGISYKEAATRQQQGILGGGLIGGLIAGGIIAGAIATGIAVAPLVALGLVGMGLIAGAYMGYNYASDKLSQPKKPFSKQGNRLSNFFVGFGGKVYAGEIPVGAVPIKPSTTYLDSQVEQRTYKEELEIRDQELESLSISPEERKLPWWKRVSQFIMSGLGEAGRAVKSVWDNLWGEKSIWKRMWNWASGERKRKQDELDKKANNARPGSLDPHSNLRVYLQQARIEAYKAMNIPYRQNKPDFSNITTLQQLYDTFNPSFGFVGGIADVEAMARILPSEWGDNVYTQALIANVIRNRVMVAQSGNSAIGGVGGANTTYKQVIEAKGGGEFSPVRRGGSYWTADLSPAQLQEVAEALYLVASGQLEQSLIEGKGISAPLTPEQAKIALNSLGFANTKIIRDGGRSWRQTWNGPSVGILSASGGKSYHEFASQQGALLQQYWIQAQSKYSVMNVATNKPLTSEELANIKLNDSAMRQLLLGFVNTVTTTGPQVLPAGIGTGGLVGGKALDTGVVAVMNGGGSPFHIHNQLNYASREQDVQMMDAIALGYRAIGREMVFSNSAVRGIKWDPNLSLGEKLKLLEKLKAAHAHSRNVNKAVDFYAVEIGSTLLTDAEYRRQPTGKSGQNAPVLVPYIEGGYYTISSFAAGSTGNTITVFDASGKKVLQIYHGGKGKPGTYQMNDIASKQGISSSVSTATPASLRKLTEAETKVVNNQAGSQTKKFLDKAKAKGYSLQLVLNEVDRINTRYKDASGKAISLHKDAAIAFEQMKKDAAAAGIDLSIVSGYRSISQQAAIIQNKVSQGMSIEEILKYSAPAGYSEHQTGMAIDINSVNQKDFEPGGKYYKVGQWLQANASKYGYTMTYGKNSNKGASYEPWHYMYTGRQSQTTTSTMLTASTTSTKNIQTEIDKIRQKYNLQSIITVTNGQRVISIDSSKPKIVSTGSMGKLPVAVLIPLVNDRLKSAGQGELDRLIKIDERLQYDDGKYQESLASITIKTEGGVRYTSIRRLTETMLRDSNNTAANILTQQVLGGVSNATLLARNRFKDKSIEIGLYGPVTRQRMGAGNYSYKAPTPVLMDAWQDIMTNKDSSEYYKVAYQALFASNRYKLLGDTSLGSKIAVTSWVLGNVGRYAEGDILVFDYDGKSRGKDTEANQQRVAKAISEIRQVMGSTGNQPQTSSQVANAITSSEVYVNLTPEEKKVIINELQAGNGYTPAMISVYFQLLGNVPSEVKKRVSEEFEEFNNALTPEKKQRLANIKAGVILDPWSNFEQQTRQLILETLPNSAVSPEFTQAAYGNPNASNTNKTLTGKLKSGINLTFDDGPDPTSTPQILAALKKAGIKATFYIVGAMAEANPELVKQIHEEGHTIGVHSYSHRNLTNLNQSDIKKELSLTKQVIEGIINPIDPKFKVSLFRAPYGETNSNINNIAKSVGLSSSKGWTVDTQDWNINTTTQSIYNSIVNAEAGATVLVHDGRDAAYQIISTPNLRQLVEKNFPGAVNQLTINKNINKSKQSVIDALIKLSNQASNTIKRNDIVASITPSAVKANQYSILYSPVQGKIVGLNPNPITTQAVERNQLISSTSYDEYVATPQLSTQDEDLVALNQAVDDLGEAVGYYISVQKEAELNKENYRIKLSIPLNPDPREGVEDTVNAKAVTTAPKQAEVEVKSDGKVLVSLSSPEQYLNNNIAFLDTIDYSIDNYQDTV